MKAYANGIDNKSGAVVVAETFQLHINISGSLTDGASKAQPSANCKTLKSHKTVIRHIAFSKLK